MYTLVIQGIVTYSVEKTLGSTLQGKNLLPCREDPFSEADWGRRTQIGSHKS